MQTFNRSVKAPVFLLSILGLWTLKPASQISLWKVFYLFYKIIFVIVCCTDIYTTLKFILRFEKIIIYKYCILMVFIFIFINLIVLYAHSFASNDDWTSIISKITEVEQILGSLKINRPKRKFLMHFRELILWIPIIMLITRQITTADGRFLLELMLFIGFTSIYSILYINILYCWNLNDQLTTLKIAISELRILKFADYRTKMDRFDFCLNVLRKILEVNEIFKKFIKTRITVVIS